MEEELREDPPEKEKSTEEQLKDIGKFGDIDVNKNLFDVTITIPADFLDEGTSQEKLDKDAAERGYKSATLNPDGSVTYVMTKEQHKKVMNETAERIDKSLSDMVGSEEYPNFVDVKANSDYTSFTIITKSTELSLTESFSVMGFYMMGGMYAVFNGEKADNIHVEFINNETGEVIDTADSKNLKD